MTTPNRPPLWEVMRDAYELLPLPVDANLERIYRNSFAAEIRAIAEEVERRGALGLDRDPGETADWLRAEADRAERGEVVG